MAMIDAIGDISGAHINPAVSIAFALSGRFPWARVGPYVLAQIAGAVLAALALRGLFPSHETLGATVPSGSAAQSFWIEVILALILMFVILRVSTGAKEKGLRASAAIGGVIAFEAMAAGPITGASMNPARSLAPAIVSLDAAAINALWIYLSAPTLGAAAAVLVDRLVSPVPKSSTND
jgi:aquaporin Z